MVAQRDVFVDHDVGMGASQHPCYARTSDIGDGALDTRVGKMQEQIPDHDRVEARWDGIADEVEVYKSTSWSTKADLEVGDHLIDDVRARVVDAIKVDLLHPREVPARGVEQRTDAEFLQQAGQSLTQLGGPCQARPGTAHRLRISPDVVPVEARE